MIRTCFGSPTRPDPWNPNWTGKSTGMCLMSFSVVVRPCSKMLFTCIMPPQIQSLALLQCASVISVGSCFPTVAIEVQCQLSVRVRVNGTRMTRIGRIDTEFLDRSIENPFFRPFPRSYFAPSKREQYYHSLKFHHEITNLISVCFTIRSGEPTAFRWKWINGGMCWRAWATPCIMPPAIWYRRGNADPEMYHHTAEAERQYANTFIALKDYPAKQNIVRRYIDLLTSSKRNSAIG